MSEGFGTNKSAFNRERRQRGRERDGDVCVFIFLLLHIIRKGIELSFFFFSLARDGGNMGEEKQELVIDF